MELSDEIADICETECKKWKEADDFMNQPNPPMHQWPITKKDNAIKVLKKYELSKFNLPNQSKYPELYKYMIKLKQNEKREQEFIRLENERKLKEMTLEFQLIKKQKELSEIDNNILHITNEIHRLQVRHQKLLNDYNEKYNEIQKIKKEIK